MKFGLPISLALHVGVFGGFTFFASEAKPLGEAKVIPVEILTVAPETNVSAAIKPTKRDVPDEQPEIMTSPTPMENAEEVAPELKVTPSVQPIEKQAEVTPEVTKDAELIPKPEKKPAPKEPSFDLDALSGLIDRTRETAPEANQQVALESETAQARFEEIARRAEGEGSGLAATEADLVANAMYKCWRMPAAAKDAENLQVRLNVKLVIGGYVESVTLIDQANSRRLSPGNEYWDVAERGAIAAVNKCAPYDFLPEERYGVWRELILNLRPQL
ncbi:MAG: hypothetical protein ABJN22_08240 [Litorimonas sp.]